MIIYACLKKLALQFKIFFHMQLVLASEVCSADILIALGLSSSLWLYVSVQSLPDGVYLYLRMLCVPAKNGFA